MRQLILIISFWRLGFSGATQELNDSVITILKNNPNASYTCLGISFDASFAYYNQALFSPGLQYNLFTPRFAISTSGRLHIWEKISAVKENQLIVSSIYESSISRDYLIQASFFFINRMVSKPMTIDHSSNSLTTSRNHQGSLINVDVNERIGLDLGFKSGFTYYSFQNFGALNGISNNGTSYLIYPYLFPPKSISTNYNYAFFKFGFSYTSVNNLSVKTSKGVTSKNYIFQFYTHLYLPIYNNVDDVYYRNYNSSTNSYYFVQFDINTNMGYHKFGAAIGINYFECKKWGLGFNLEVGCLPGPWFSLIDAQYVNLSAKFSLGTFLKK